MWSELRRRSTGALLIATIPWIAGCGGDGGTDPDPEPQNGAIAGTIRESGASGIAGVAVTLSGTASKSTTSSSTGAYNFQDLAAGSYTVTVTPPEGYELADGESATRSVTVSGGATATADFELRAGGDDGGNEVRIVNLQNLQFSASELRISVGETVRWVNKENMTHTVTPDGHSEWSEATLTQAEQAFEHTFDTAGTFNYYCAPHRSAGMTGRIIVE